MNVLKGLKKSAKLTNKNYTDSVEKNSTNFVALRISAL